MKKLLAAVLLAGLAFVACQKEFSIENGQSGSLTGAWEFKDSTTSYAGNSVQYYIDDTSNPASANMVYTGATANLGATISIDVYFPTGTAAIGSYQSANGQVNFSYIFNNSGKKYEAIGLGGQFSTENVTVNITQISDSSVTGTFSGIALDSASRLVPIKAGKFSYRKRVVTTPAPTTSVGTLGTATDTCTGAVVSGTYKKNAALATTNTVRLSVNVTTAGTYTISTDTLKGIYFASTGSFSATGVQSISLQGIGTPTDSAAALRFRVRYGTSSCTFLLKIDTASGVVVVPPTGDYFPLTTNSNWSYNYYDQSGAMTDSVYVRSTGTFKTLGTNAFNIFVNTYSTPPTDSSFYRKSNGIYYRGIDLDDYVGAGGVQQTQMLKDNVPVSSTWTDTYSNITVPGFPIPITIKIDYTISAKAVAATVGSLSFADVIKVQSVVSAGVPGAFTPQYNIETWFAKGTGLIYQKIIDNTATTTTFDEQKLRRSQVF